jgi:endonuclease YncB( thermonuclease family)
MAKHWNPRTAHRGRIAPYRAPLRIRFGARELRLMALAGLFGGLVLSDLPIPGLGTTGTPPAEAHFAAVDVIDGDTFRYGGETIRIADIDTPEVRGRCAYETKLAARATDRLEELLAAGPFALKSIARDEDRYGRKLRIVTRGGHSLGDVLVAEGLARTWTGRRMPWCGA